jgi:hypothetical protein
MVKRGIVVPEFEEVSEGNESSDNATVTPPESPAIEDLKPSQ